MAYLFIAGTVFFTVYGQIVLKWRIVKYGALPELTVDKFYFFLKLFTDPFIISGLLSAFIASLFWMATMTKLDISFAYPFITAGLTVSTVVIAIIFLNEPVTTNNIIGVLLIISGVFIMSSSA